MSPRVSFVVRAYNYGRFLNECLASIFALDDPPDYEIIVIDDGSRDETQAVLDGFRDPRLRRIRHERNLGHVVTINEGLEQARGEFIARIDADDRYRPHFLTETLPRFETRPDVGLVYGDVALIDTAGAITAPNADRVHNGHDFVGNELVSLLEDNYICAPSVIARREVWLTGWPVPAWVTADDWYLNLQMARRFNFWYLNIVLADYRVHAYNHHVQTVREGKEEPSVRRILDGLYAESEVRPELEQAKRRARREVYAGQYFALGDKYFGCGMYSEARRCYLAAVRYKAAHGLRPALLRRVAATFVGRGRYESLKARVRRPA